MIGFMFQYVLGHCDLDLQVPGLNFDGDPLHYIMNKTCVIKPASSKAQDKFILQYKAIYLFSGKRRDLYL